MKNEMTLSFDSISENEAFARSGGGGLCDAVEPYTGGGGGY